MTDFEYVQFFGPIMDFSVSRIKPDGSEIEIIMEDVQYSDLSEDGKKILYIDQELLNLNIYNTETMDTISSITDIYPVNTRFTLDENIVLFLEGSQNSPIQTLYKYSFTDSSTIMLSDSLSTSFNNMTISPDGQQIVYFKVTEDENTEDDIVDVDVVVADIQNGESAILATIPYFDISNVGLFYNNPYWGNDGFIYLSFLAGNCSQIFRIHSSLGYITQLTDNPCSGLGYYCISSILRSRETNLDKFVYMNCGNDYGYWIYDITSNESSYLGNFNPESGVSIPMDQSWSPDQTKVVFNEWIYGGVIVIPGYMRVYDTVTESIDTVGNILNLEDPESYYAAGPIHWINENNDSNSIEGRWIIPVVESDPGNTMYEFLDGLRYTYYCSDENGCDSTYWNSLDTNDAIPNPNPYTFSNDTLTIDLFFGNTWQHPISFECDGNVVTTGDTTVTWWSSWWRVGYDISECEGQELALTNATKYPDTFKLSQNYPNPFNPVTSLRYDLPEEGLVNITVYDMMGRVVKTLVNGSQTAGYKSIKWNATNNRNEPVSAGLYLYTIQAGEFRQTRKMVLLK